MTTHGMTGTPTYRSWKDMRRRCYNKNRDDYKHYGGRGIKVCDRWRYSFENFLTDMGIKPTGLTLERKNVNKGYSKENCKWATIKEQRRNTTLTTWLMVDGKRMNLQDAAEYLGIKHNTLWNRLKRSGWTPERAVKESTYPANSWEGRIMPTRSTLND